MKIIKHGVLPPDPQFLFKCPNCGCQFIMTQTELRQEYQSLVYPSRWCCPECGTDVQGEEIKEGTYNGK